MTLLSKRGSISPPTWLPSAASVIMSPKYRLKLLSLCIPGIGCCFGGTINVFLCRDIAASAGPAICCCMATASSCASSHSALELELCSEATAGSGVMVCAFPDSLGDDDRLCVRAPPKLPIGAIENNERRIGAPSKSPVCTVADARAVVAAPPKAPARIDVDALGDN